MYLRHENENWTGLATFSKFCAPIIIKTMGLAHALATGTITTEEFTLENSKDPETVQRWIAAATYAPSAEMLAEYVAKGCHERDVKNIETAENTEEGDDNLASDDSVSIC